MLIFYKIKIKILRIWKKSITFADLNLVIIDKIE